MLMPEILPSTLLNRPKFLKSLKIPPRLAESNECVIFSSAASAFDFLEMVA